MSLQIMLSIPTGFSISTLSFFYMSSILGFNIIHVVIHVILLMILNGALFLIHKNILQKRISYHEIVYMLASVSVGFYFSYVFYFRSDEVPDAVHRYMSEELALTHSFYHGCNSGFVNIFKIRHPFCYKCVARSRYLTAIGNAMHMISGSTLSSSLFLTSFIFISCISFMILHISRAIIKNTYMVFLVLFICYFHGGFGYLYFPTKSVFKSHSDLVSKIGNVRTKASNILFNYLFGYRPNQFAFSCCLTILCLLNDESFIKQPSRGIIYITFLTYNIFTVSFPTGVSSIIFFITYLVTSDLKNVIIKKAKYYPLIYIIVLSPQFFSLPRSTSKKMFTYDCAYDMYTIEGYIFPFAQYIFDVYGIMTLFIPFLPLTLDYSDRGFFVGAMVIMVLSINFLFGSLDLNNYEFIYPYTIPIFAILCIKVFTLTLDHVLDDEVCGVVIGMSIVFSILTTLSGFIGFTDLIKITKPLFAEKEMKLMKFLLENTQKDALYMDMISDSSNSIARYLGRVILSSDKFLLDTSNFNDIYGELLAKTKGDPNLINIKKLQYIVHDNKNYLPTSWKEEYNQDGFIVLKK